MSSQNREKSLKAENYTPGQSKYNHPTGATAGGVSYAKSRASAIPKGSIPAYKIIKKKGYGKK